MEEMNDIKIKIKKVRNNSKIPTNDGTNVGWDCYISQFHNHDILSRVKLNQGEIIGCRLGFKTEIPKGYYAKIVPRSGLALKHGITIVNSPGTIDSGYRGEWIAIITNLKNKPCVLYIGDKICQFIIQKIINIELINSDLLNKSIRNDKGFGSTDD